MSLRKLFETVTQALSKRNSKKYNMKKACEELSELNTVLMQTLNKWNSPDKRPDKQEIIDEIGDVLIRVRILALIVGDRAVKRRIIYKLTKYKEYIDENMYKEI